MQIRDPLTGVCGGADYAFLRMFEKKKNLTSHVLDQFKVSQIL